MDCKSIMEKFNEVGETEEKKEESKDASDTAGLLEKLTVEETKMEEKPVEKRMHCCGRVMSGHITAPLWEKEGFQNPRDRKRKG
ncbi:unnamed protein product, partial [Thlaspi arvense]